VNIRERRIYQLELKLIRKYFRGLRPRPVQLAKKLELGADGEAGEPNLIIKDRKLPRQELEALLKHELIHYQLKDWGNVYHGHGAAFLKRAQELGIVNSYVLQRCFSSEEFEHTPTVRRTKKVSLTKFKRQVDHWFTHLLEEVLNLPSPHNTSLYPYVQNAYVGWMTFSAAVKEKSNHVIQEIWQIKKGPRGKGLHELQKEYGALQKQRATLLKKFKKRGKRLRDEITRRQVKFIEAKIEKIQKTVAKDYGLSLRSADDVRRGVSTPVVSITHLLHEPLPRKLLP